MQQGLFDSSHGGRDLETIRGELVSFQIRTADNWGTGTVRIDGSGPAYERETTVTGKLVGCRPGDTVELEGKWHDHPRWGKQFKVRRAMVAEPDSDEGRIKWMASRLPNLGEQRAKALIERFGSELWTIIETEPARLVEVDGITAERAEGIAKAYVQFRAERDAMVQLRGWGLTDNQVERCVAHWKSLEKVLEHLTADPYELCVHIYGFGFRRADAVARKMGVPLEAPSRVRAGLEFVLDNARQQGHCYMAGAALQEMAAKELGVDKSLVGQQIVESAEIGRLVRRGWRVFANTVDRAEQLLADRLTQMLAGEATTEAVGDDSERGDAA